MTELISRILSFFGQFKLFVMIMPWERAARIRLGSRVVIWEPGWHVKLPFVDEIVLMNSRLRITDTGALTLTTASGETLTVGLSIGFRIDDPLAVLLKMQQPEAACAAIAGSVVASLVTSTRQDDLTPGAIEVHVEEKLHASTPYAFEFVRVQTFAYTQAYRILQETGWRENGKLTIEERKL